MTRNMDKIKGKGKIDFEDDLVRIYEKGEMIFEGYEEEVREFFDYDEPSWRYNPEMKRYETDYHGSKLIEIRI